MTAKEHIQQPLTMEIDSMIAPKKNFPFVHIIPQKLKIEDIKKNRY
jgi:hypothetical protein